MAAVNMKDGLVKLLKKDYLNHGIDVSIDENNKITLDFHVIIAYGVSIATVADNLMETVKYKVEAVYRYDSQDRSTFTLKASE